MTCMGSGRIRAMPINTGRGNQVCISMEEVFECKLHGPLHSRTIMLLACGASTLLHYIAGRQAKLICPAG